MVSTVIWTVHKLRCSLVNRDEMINLYVINHDKKKNIMINLSQDFSLIRYWVQLKPKWRNLHGTQLKLHQ